MFEVDHPASQEAKRSALAVAGIPVPGNVTFVPADLAAGSLVRCLAGAGFDRSAPAVFCWLGVTMYLTMTAIAETMTAIADLARRAGLGAVRSVRQRDTVPAGLWRRTDSLHPAELAVLFHAAVTGD